MTQGRQFVKPTTLLAVFLVLGCNSESKQNGLRIDSSAQVHTDSTAQPLVEGAPGTQLPGPTPLNDTAPVPLNAAPVQAGTPNRAFACNSPVRAHDTLTIRMPQPHGQYLAIKYPDGHFYYVVYPTSGVPGRVSLMESTAFRSLNEIRLVVGETKGTPWIYQRDVPEPLLAKPGKYRIMVNDNMGTDVESSSPEYSCQVTVLANR